MTRSIILAAGASLALLAGHAAAQEMTPAQAVQAPAADNALPGVATNGQLQPGGDRLMGPGGLQNNVGATGQVLPLPGGQPAGVPAVPLSGLDTGPVPPRGGVPIETQPQAD